jgi:hypothetical protein
MLSKSVAQAPHKSSAAPRLAGFAAFCLMGTALSAMPAVAQDKSKPEPAAASSQIVVEHSISIPSVDAVDSNVDAETITEILSGNFADHAEALSGLTATSITVPEIELVISGEDDGDAFVATLTFSALVLSDVVDGVAGSVSLGETTLASDEADVTYGVVSASDFNIAGLLGFYGLVEPGADASMQTIYRDFSAEGGTLVGEEIDCTIGPVSGAEFRARPLETSLVDMIAMFEQLEDEPDDMDPATLSALMHVYADLLTAFETSEVSFGGIACEGLDDDGSAVGFTVAGMTMGAMSPGTYPSFSMDGFDITVEGDGEVSLDNFTVKPMDVSTLVATLQSAPERVDDAWFEANARNLIPEMEGIAIRGISVDIEDPDNEDARIQGAVGAFDLTLENYRNGIPTNFAMSADNFVGDVPAGTGDETLEQLRSLGVTDFDLGFRFATSWDEAASTIDIEEISLTGVDLGTLRLAGAFGNATDELFDLDPDVALQAAMGAAVHSLRLDVEDAGIINFVIAAVAQDQGVNPADLRPIYADIAQGTVIGALAGIADAAKLGDAVNSFISGRAENLAIEIGARDDAGIPIPDLMAAENDPASVLNQVNISAVAK